MRTALVSLSLLGLLLSPRAIDAKGAKPEDVLGGRIMLSDKAFPSEAKSPSAYVTAVKKQSKDRFQEDKEKQQWKIYYAAFFKKPLNDLEVKATLYDVTDGSQRFIESWEEYLNDRGQRAIIGNMKLKRGDAGLEPNSKLMLVMEDKGRIVASASFYVLGEKKKFSGKVEFSEEDTKAKDSDEDSDPDVDADKAADDKPAPVKKKGSK